MNKQDQREMEKIPINGPRLSKAAGSWRPDDINYNPGQIKILQENVFNEFKRFNLFLPRLTVLFKFIFYENIIGRYRFFQ